MLNPNLIELGLRIGKLEPAPTPLEPIGIFGWQYGRELDRARGRALYEAKRQGKNRVIGRSKPTVSELLRH